MANSAPSGAAIFAKRLRVTPLDSLGNLIPGSSYLATDTMVKLTLTPVVESGDDIFIKGASGDGVAFAKHGDMIKRYTVALDLGTPDPQLEAILAGGVVFNDTTAGLGAPTGLTVTAKATGGTLPAGQYGYRVAQYNANGATLASAEVTVATTGSTSSALLKAMTLAAGGTGWILYGRTIGGEQMIGRLRGIGTQATSAASGVGSPATLSVTALTEPIPAGYTFTVAGDTNASPIIFTTTSAAGAGAVVLQVSVSEAITTTIAAGAIVPTFVDYGSVVPSGVPNTTDMSAGLGNAIGYQAPELGVVANPNGVSIEAWSEHYLNGEPVTAAPYLWHVLPRVRNGKVMPRDVTNANMQSIYEGDATGNANWGSGPDGTWDVDSSKVIQRRLCSGLVVPVASVEPQAVLV